MSEDAHVGRDRCRRRLEQVGFGHSSNVLAELLSQAVTEQLSLAGFLELLLSSEKRHREEKRMRTWLKWSGLPVGKTIESYDFGFGRGVDKAKVELLATCEFARRKESVLLLGPAGVGKTHLAAGLGVKLIGSGCPVWFVLADQLVEMMRRDEANQRRIGMRKYMTCRVLIIDELGFQALDRADANRLFRVINHRYERGSTIITSNKSIREWPAMLAGDEALATAILDRLLHRCHVLPIDGASYRLRHLDQRLMGKEGG